MRKKDTFCASETSFDAHKLYSPCLNDKACAIIFPNCLKLLHLMLIFPLSTACVQRFFSKMKLVKTRIRNQLSQVNLENLLFIATEAPKTGFTNSEYDLGHSMVDHPMGVKSKILNSFKFLLWF